MVFGPSSVQAVGEPTVSWVSDDNQVVAGVATFEALATPTSPATIKKWCLLFDGAPVTSNVSTYSAPYYDLPALIFSGGTGCWSNPSGYLRDVRETAVRWDTTAWAPGPHTLQWTVTDTSDRSVTSSVLTFTTNNAGPSVSWVSANNQVVSGVATFDALAGPAGSGTATIKKWCLLFDGSPVTSDVAAYASRYNNIYGSTFSAQTGCWSGDARNATIQFDTTTWALGWHTLQWTVTDTSNRTATSNVLTFSTNNPQPYMVIGNLVPGQVLTGQAEVYLAAMHPGASYVSSYFFVDVAPWGSGSYTSVYPQFTTVRKVVLDTTKMRNGNHIFVGLVNDSAGRQIWSSIIPFSTYNTASSISPAIYNVAQAWPSKSVDASLVGNYSNTNSITVRYGTNRRNLSTAVTLAVVGGVVQGAIGGLKAATTYYFEIKGSGTNGDSAAVVTSSKTPKSSSKPYVSSGGSGGGSYSSGGSSGGSSWA